MVNVLVVDDSAFIRRSLITLLEKDPLIKVVGQAKDGEEAIAMNASLDPDVVTLDVEMPRMDGLTALKKIMETHPVPVIMVSSLTSEGAQTTLKALDAGALDFMPKMSSSALDSGEMAELISKIKALARRKAYVRLVQGRKNPTAAVARSNAALEKNRKPPVPVSRGKFSMPAIRPGMGFMFDVVAIGVSTGGPPAVQRLLGELPAGFNIPVLIAQHMPATFTGAFAKRLDGQCVMDVKEAEDGERLRSGTVYVCPGGKHIRLENRRGTLTVAVTEEPKSALYKPSANVLMETVGETLGRRALGVTLTGMGNDGLEGTKVLKAKGGVVFAQSEASCVVYGMPKAIVDAGLVDEVVDLEDMAAAIVSRSIK